MQLVKLKFIWRFYWFRIERQFK